MWTESFSNTLSENYVKNIIRKLCEKHHQRTRAEKIISARYFFSVFFSNKKLKYKKSVARLNKAKLTKVDNQVRICYRNNFPLSFSRLVVELDVG